jgi:carboxymethylenebutenolidase
LASSARWRGQNIRGRLVLHVAERDGFCPPEAQARIREALSGQPGVELYVYPGMDHAFARTGGEHFDKASALMAHQRSIAAFRAEMGPHYDFSALWDKHCEYEFATRDVDATMATMVAEPYVNHIPTMTGGVATGSSSASTSTTSSTAIRPTPR